MNIYGLSTISQIYFHYLCDFESHLCHFPVILKNDLILVKSLVIQ